ncbi:MAG: excinuclease ABC subunit UvrC [Candidatus Latescibacterota bacterium]|nr:excinuclease ABC subunit UvrC [Candidatus Latescibacterota bacterium]
MKKTLSEDLRLKLDALPTDPGVYIMKRGDGQIIYVGKAKNLRHRIRSYFQESAGDGRRQFKALVRNIADLDYIVTGTEQEALILEATQIKTHKPRDKILLKDDKKYPYIRITNEAFPRIFATRDIIRDGSRYLGPYSNVRAMHTTLDMLRKVFPVRSCDFQLPKDSVRLCLEYHIERCEGPCEKLVAADEYKKTIDGAVRFLRGQNSEVIKGLQRQMAEAADDMRFEKAARCRDQLKALESMRARQKVVFDDQVDRDVLGVARNDDEACCSVLEIREGRLLGKKHHFLGGVMDSSDGEFLSAFARQFYLQNDFVPAQIHLRVQPPDADEIADWLSQKIEGKVELATPQRGTKAQMLEMAERNAAQMLAERAHKREMKRDRVPQSVYALQRDLNLETLPRRIEGIDISNFQGAHSVGSLVCFIDGQAKRSQYRYFKIKDLEQPDDYASIHQVVHRRFRGLKERGEAFPDLLLIDGGKGQLSSAVEALRELGVENQPVLGIAKRFEEVFLPDEAKPRLLPKTSASLRLLQMLRDEAHRFALKNHRDQRAKSTLTSALDDIPGIGPKKRNVLLKAFGSVKRIAATPIAEITAIPGFSPKQAVDLLAHLNGPTGDQMPEDHGDDNPQGDES